MTTKEQTKHDIVHWSVIKHASQHEDLVILTKPRKQHYNQSWRLVWHIEEIHT